MKKIACALLLTGGITGCFHTQPEAGSMKSAFPWTGTETVAAKPAPPVAEKPAVPRQVSAEQVTPNNARQMADALLQEMDRAE
jgi:hypothetical protein